MADVMADVMADFLLGRPEGLPVHVMADSTVD